MTSLPEKVLAVHSSLRDASVPHAFGGAIALAYCTQEQRATSDLDLNVFVPAARSGSVLKVLPAEIRIEAKARQDLRKRGQARLWWDDNPVDLFFNNHAFHDSAAGRIREVPFEATSIPILDCTDLLVFKALFARPKDWIDIAAMIAADSIDVPYATRWLGELVGTESSAYRRVMQLAEARGSGDEVTRLLFGEDSESDEQR